MKTVCKLDNCAGCMACIDICPVKAITFKDGIVSLNSVIDEEKCIECKACINVCPQISPPDFISPMEWFQGWADNDIRSFSSSGGIASSLMRTFIKNGGIVCTCVFEKGIFGFKFIENDEQIKNASGSKYIKSNPEGIYKAIRKFLIDGIKVLMIGLPCQTAAVIKYCDIKYTNILYTVDLICHGSPSPKILQSYLEEQGYCYEKINKIDFRNKTLFGLILDDKKIFPENVRDRYTIGFLNGVFYTNNCYQCQYARRERVSDLTLGDSWGSELSEEEKAKGISLVFCQTNKGKELLQNSNLILRSVDIENAIANNHQLYRPSIKTKEHDVFFHYFWSGKGVTQSITRCYKQHCFKQDVKSFLHKLKLFN